MVCCWHGNLEDCEIGSEEWIKAIMNPATCMLPLGHGGQHVYTPDQDIIIIFQDCCGEEV